ncbi:4-alpha-glucanotransferase, partial [Staphylococcus hominis]
LNRYQVFSYKVVYFSKGWHGFELPEEYPEQAITVVSTHDVAPLAGYWTGKDLDLMFRLGTIPDAETFQTTLEAREHDKADLFDKLKH